MAAGTPLCGIQSGALGRKKTIMLTQVVSLMGAFCILFANTATVFYLGNFLSGYTNSVFIGIAPIYTSEICQPNIRKFTGGFLAVEFSVGFAVTYFAGSLSHWKTAALIQAAWPCIVFFVMILCPESPTWLLSKGRKDEAFRTIANLRGDSNVAAIEVSRIENNFMKQKAVTDASSQSSYVQRQFEIMKEGTFLRPCLVLTVLMAICWQWTGRNVLVFHLLEILEDLEVPIPADWASAGLGLYQLLGGLAGIAVSSLVSRRSYYIGSGISIFLGTTILAILIHLQRYDYFVEIIRKNPEIRWVPLIALLLYFGGCSMGWVSVCFMLIGELLPSNGKELGSFIAVECSNISAIILFKLLPDLTLYLGMDGLFCLFSCVTIFSIVFAYYCIPDTFGKALEEIEDHYRNMCYGAMKNIQQMGQVTTVSNKGFISD